MDGFEPSNFPTDCVMPKKLVSWNVNGLRAVLKKGFLDFVREVDADVICLQETKCRPEQVHNEFELAGYHQFWNSAEKKGYSGTAIFSRLEPVNVTTGIGIADHDNEGRVLTAEYDGFYLVNVYTPNAQRTLDRLPYRQEWDVAFLDYLKGLEAAKPVIFCGDLNVAHTEIDLANPKTNQQNAGFTPEERAGFDRIVAAGFIDSFRDLNPDVRARYSWWSYMNQARTRNIGWRIDYFCLSASLKGRLKHADILHDVHGSDHCPVTLELHPLESAVPAG